MVAAPEIQCDGKLMWRAKCLYVALPLVVYLTSPGFSEAACPTNSADEKVTINVVNEYAALPPLHIPKKYISEPPAFLGTDPQRTLTTRPAVTLIVDARNMCPVNIDLNNFYKKENNTIETITISPSNNFWVNRSWEMARKNLYKTQVPSEIEIEKFGYEKISDSSGVKTFAYFAGSNPKLNIQPIQITCTHMSNSQLCILASQVDEKISFKVNFHFDQIQNWKEIYLNSFTLIQSFLSE